MPGQELGRWILGESHWSFNAEKALRESELGCGWGGQLGILG